MLPPLSMNSTRKAVAGRCAPQDIPELRHAEHRVHGVHQRQATGCGAPPCAARAGAIRACSAGIRGTAASRNRGPCGTVRSSMHVCGTQRLCLASAAIRPMQCAPFAARDKLICALCGTCAPRACCSCLLTMTGAGRGGCCTCLHLDLQACMHVMSGHGRGGVVCNAQCHDA